MANPLDTGTPIVPPDVLKASIKEVLQSESIDILLLVLLIRPLEVELGTFMDMMGVDSGPPGSYLEELLPVLAQLKTEFNKDMVVVFENRATSIAEASVEKTSRKMRAMYQSLGIPIFSNVQRALRGISHAVALHKRKIVSEALRL